jgi:hypothetical protein
MTYDDDDDEQGREQEQEKEPENLTPLTLSNTVGMTQLNIDVINVFEKRVSIDSFSKEYQKKIKDFYRFSPVNNNSSNGNASGNGRSSWK